MGGGVFIKGWSPIVRNNKFLGIKNVQPGYKGTVFSGGTGIDVPDPQPHTPPDDNDFNENPSEENPSEEDPSEEDEE